MAKQAQINEVRPVLEATDSALDKIEGALNVLDAIADKSSDAVESGLEKVADVVPDVLDTSVHVSTKGARGLVHYFRSPKHAAMAVVIASSLVGAGLGVAGYFLTVKRVRTKLQAEFDERLEAEIGEMRQFYARRNKDGEFSTPQAVVEALLTQEAADALKSYQGEEVKLSGAPEMKVAPAFDKPVASEEELAALREKLKAGPIEIEKTAHNIFVDGHPIEEFDYEAEVAMRTPDEPYVITHDEFMENTNDWETNSLTYYNGDDILTDERDVPMPDDVVGGENLAKFGYGSRDGRIVYVCNERINTLFEIALSDGKYSEEVAGLQHSAPLRRFRRGDDE